jgi:hypothetical protein
MNAQSLSILNEVTSGELHKNVNALPQYMHVYNLPLASRNALNEVLHDMKTVHGRERGSHPRQRHRRLLRSLDVGHGAYPPHSV